MTRIKPGVTAPEFSGLGALFGVAMDVPGFGRLEERRKAFQAQMAPEGRDGYQQGEGDEPLSLEPGTHGGAIAGEA